MRTLPARLAIAVAATTLALGTVACSGGDDDSAAANGAEVSAETNGATDDGAGDNADGGSAGGSASITIGERTWAFDQVQCGFGEDEIGSPGAQLVVAASEGSFSLYVSVEEDFSYIELSESGMGDDALTWTTQGVGDAGPLISESGGSVTSTAAFVNYGAGDGGDSETAEGTLEATCP